jgi:hypothetical protein
MTLSKSIRGAVVLVVIGMSTPAGPGAAPQTASGRLAPIARRHIPIVIRERRNSVTTSTNWSGYAVTGARNAVTDVKASWTVPAIQSACPSTNQYSSFWVGIDGYNSNTVEQIGTDSDCQGGVPTYYAWFEFYPHWSYGISLSPQIAPGDKISAEVTAGAGGLFTVSLTNVTTGQSFSTSVKMNSAQRSSAEWIAEAPWSGGVLPLADFGAAEYGVNYTSVVNTSYATVSGRTGPIGSFGLPDASNSPVQEITMVTSSGASKAAPTSLSTDGSSFKIQRVSAVP